MKHTPLQQDGSEQPQPKANADNNQADNPSVVMYEDWSVRPDGTYYRYRFEGETEWHEKLTGHKGSPFIKFVCLSNTELNDMVERGVLEPPRGHSKPPNTPNIKDKGDK